jgi:NAD+ synthase (glutamine-hydrolysing)
MHVAHELLRNRARPASFSKDVVLEGAGDADDVHSVVLIEPVILDCDKGLRQILRQRFDPNVDADLLPDLADERSIAREHQGRLGHGDDRPGLGIIDLALLRAHQGGDKQKRSSGKGAQRLIVPLRYGNFRRMDRPVHLVVVQFKPRKGDYASNLARLPGVFSQIDSLDPRPDVAVFAETALTGYFVEGGVRDVAMTAGAFARDLQAQYASAVTTPRTLDVCIGFYEEWNNAFYNSALYVTLGGDEPVIRHVHRKLFLPTYGLFDEERFVDRGFEVRAFDTEFGRVAMLICEDAWHSLASTVAALDGATMVFVVSASPARGVWPREDEGPVPANLKRWERLARDIAEEHGVFVALVNLVGTEGGKTFAGGSIVCGPHGDIRARAPLWDETIMTISLDPHDLTRARSDAPLLTDLQTMMPHLMRTVDRIQAGERLVLSYDDEPSDGGPLTPADRTAAAKHAAANAQPAKTSKSAAKTSGASRNGSEPISVVRAPESRSGPPPLEIDPELTAGWLVSFLREEFERRGFEKAVVGLSGGVDSAVTAFLSERALGKENVVAVRMPYRTSNPDSLAHAQLVIDAIGIQSRTVDISPAVDGYLASEPDADPARRGNVMARERMIVLFDLSAKYHALPVGTGNKTERLLGYFTWHADDSPPINPLGDLFKTQVWELARYLGVPDVIVSKPASADLIAGQTDEGDFGIGYAEADKILNWLVSGYSPASLLARGFKPDDVELVRKRLAGTHWKRKLPTVALLSPTGIGESYLRPVDY